MKEQAVNKINKMGKVSNVVVTICKVCIIIGIVIFGLAGAGCILIPDGSMRVVSTEKVAVELEYDKFGAGMEEAEILNLVKGGVDGLLINNKEVAVEEVDITGNKLTVTQEAQQFELDFHDLGWMNFVLVIMLVLVLITLIFAGGLCKAFRDCESPFEENVIQKMQHFAYSLIPWTVGSSGITAVKNLMLGETGFMLSVDLWMVLIVLVVFMLVSIFKYGAVLQQESDETL